MPRRRATLKDVADAVGVHVSTVSRALNPDTRHTIRPAVVQTIVAAVERIGYKPNAAARSLRTNKTKIIGVVIPDIANPVFPPIIRGIEDALSERGYMAILVNSARRNPRYTDLVDVLRAHGVDGLIIASVVRDDEVIRSLVSDAVPVVTINRRADDPTVPSVIHDDGEGIRLILEHLRQLGHKRVVNIAPPQNTSTGKARYDAFERYRREFGFDLAPELAIFADSLNEEQGELCAARALDALSNFTALVTSNDRLAIGAISLLRQRGVSCPADMSITGFNDMPWVGRFDPPLTTVRVRQQEAGRRGGELLLKRLDGVELSEAERHVVMPVELVVRQSTGKPAKRRKR